MDAYDYGYRAGRAGTDGEALAKDLETGAAFPAGLPVVAQSDLWLGYYHGRWEHKTGRPSPGRLARSSN